MIRFGSQLLAATLSLPAFAADFTIPDSVIEAVARHVETGIVTLLDEHHRRPESPALVARLAEVPTRDDRCMVVALEIDSDQNDVLTRVMAGEAGSERVAIHPIIDNPALRRLIDRLRDLAATGRCPGIRAIDLPERLWSTGISRDEWMAEQLAALVDPFPILALLGNLHVLREVPRRGDGGDRRFVAVRLSDQGIGVRSILQDWPGDCAPRRGRSHDRATPQAEAVHRTVRQRVQGLAAQPNVGVDGVVIRECTDTIP